MQFLHYLIKKKQKNNMDVLDFQQTHFLSHSYTEDTHIYRPMGLPAAL